MRKGFFVHSVVSTSIIISLNILVHLKPQRDELMEYVVPELATRRRLQETKEQAKRKPQPFFCLCVCVHVRERERERDHLTDVLFPVAGDLAGDLSHLVPAGGVSESLSTVALFRDTLPILSLFRGAAGGDFCLFMFSCREHATVNIQLYTHSVESTHNVCLLVKHLQDLSVVTQQTQILI